MINFHKVFNNQTTSSKQNRQAGFQQRFIMYVQQKDTFRTCTRRCHESASDLLWSCNSPKTACVSE